MVAFEDVHHLRQQIRERLAIVDVISEFLPLQAARTGFVAQCPWHDDRRPSLQVNPRRRIWRCWVCDVGGDVVSFVMHYKSLTASEAIWFLALPPQ